MVGMDFLGPISPACAATGASYVLIVFDYFLRFVWAHPSASADQAAVYNFWMGTLAPTYGFPQALYIDNGSHFAGSEIISYSKVTEHELPLRRLATYYRLVW